MSNVVTYCTYSNMKVCESNQCTNSNQCTISNALGSGAQGIVKNCGDNKVVKISNNEELKGEYEFLNYENDLKDIYVARMYPVIKDNGTCDKKKIVMDKVMSFKTYLEEDKVNDDIDLRFLLIRKLMAATAFLNFKIKYSHNDIKPDNIGIHPENKHIRFIDMGGSTPINEKFVYSFNNEGPEYTQTLMFSAPIMMENIQDVYVRDRWATACTIYYIVSKGHFMIDTDGATVNIQHARLFFVLMMLDMDGIEYMLGFINDKPKYVNDKMKTSREEFVKGMQEYNTNQRRLIYTYLIDVFIPNVLSSRSVEQKIENAKNAKNTQKEAEQAQKAEKAVDTKVNALFGTTDDNKENVDINEKIVDFIEKGTEGAGVREGGGDDGAEGAGEGESSKKDKNEIIPDKDMMKRANEVVKKIREKNVEKNIDIEYHLERLRMKTLYMQ